MWRPVNRPTRSLNGLQQGSRLLVLLVIVLIVTAIVFITNGAKPSSPFGMPQLKWNSFQTSITFRPSLEFMNGTDVIWQIPDSPPKGVLFLAHGCNGRAANFWDRSPSCPNCVGLPEERLIVLHALDRGFAVLTISSMGRCWSFGKEKETVKWIIKWWVEEHKLEKVPLVAMGASSGGNFVSALANEMRFSSIVIMIAEGIFEQMGVSEGYPPTLFLHMPKDRVRMKLIEMNMEALRRKSVDVREIRCLEFPLTRDFLSDRIPGLDQNFSGQLFALFREKGFVDENGYMRKDGRRTLWKKAVKEKGLSSERYEWDDHIQEELNLAYGYHEMTSLQSDDILDWFESHMR